MKRWSALFVVLGTLAWAKPNQAAEAGKVLDQYLSGALGLNAAVNRIQYLGMEPWVAVEVLPKLKRVLNPRARSGLLEFLAALGVRDPDVERAFISYLGSDETGDVVPAARGLGRIKSAAAVGPLVGLLGHQASGVRREAARALGEIGKPAASAPLLKAAKAEGELELKLLMITAAGRAGDARQASALEALLNEGSESTRLAAGQALCTLGVRSCAPFAQKLLASTVPAERLQGVMLFEGAPVKLSRPLLTPLLKAPDDKLRARAARVLAQAGDASMLEWLVLESAKAGVEVRLVYEDELERLRLTDEQRQAILRKAGR